MILSQYHGETWCGVSNGVLNIKVVYFEFLPIQARSVNTPAGNPQITNIIGHTEVSKPPVTPLFANSATRTITAMSMITAVTKNISKKERRNLEGFTLLI
jgi:hypothetical protein